MDVTWSLTPSFFNVYFCPHRFLLQNDVAIAQDRYMWDEILLDNRGSKDIILSIVRGLGDKGMCSCYQFTLKAFCQSSL